VTFEPRVSTTSSTESRVWPYCREKLGLPEGATWRRITAAGLLARFPVAADYMRNGRLWMSTLVALKDVLTEENAADLFEKTARKSKNEIERIVTAIRFPAPVAVPDDRIRKEPAAAPVVAPAAEPLSPAEVVAPCAPAAPPPAAPETLPRPEPRDSVEPVSATQYRISMVVSAEFVETLEKVMDLMSHSHPSRKKLEPFLRKGLELVLAQEAKRRAEPSRQVAPRPKKDVPAGTRETIPAAVERAVWRRDGGKCTWKREDGTVCGSTFQVEIDHVVPVAHGGTPEANQLRLLCSRCNLLHARRVFGSLFVDERIAQARRRRKTPTDGAARAPKGDPAATPP
jgi:5-methylcytosine-specific restriction endonuclease McrA